MSDGVVNIRGKEYKTVAKRIADFRKDFPGATISTEAVSISDEVVVMKASIMFEDRLIATGYAEEFRTASNINKTSALENAETSAVGRALAFYGLGGSEIASADEVANAISQQNDTGGQVFEEWRAYMELVREHFDWVMYAKTAIANQDWQELAGIWGDIDHDTMAKLFLAPSKGGIFTTEERNACKGNDEFSRARKELANA